MTFKYYYQEHFRVLGFSICVNVSESPGGIVKVEISRLKGF